MSKTVLKNKMRILTPIKIVVFGALASLGLNAHAQVQMDALAPANTYDAGVLEAGQSGLSPDLWQGTSAERAAALIQNLPSSPSPAAKMLIRTVLLSGGVPPQANGELSREHYVTTRLGAVLGLGENEAYDTIIKRSSINFSSPSTQKLGVTHALFSGDVPKACQIADGIKLERKSPYWAKLRAFCHVTRDEIPAAELTADLLKRSGHQDTGFTALLGNLTGSQVKFPNVSTLKTPLHIAMAQSLITKKKFKPLPAEQIKAMPPRLARTIALASAQASAMDAKQSPKIRLSAFLRSALILTPKQMSQILAGFDQNPVNNSDTLAGDTVWTLEQWGQTFNAVKASTDTARTSTLIAALLSQAEKQGIFIPIAKFLGQDIALIPASLQAKDSPRLFARIAVQNRELSTLQELYLALPEDNSFRGRLALASDALGGGFLGSGLGTDIETRLGSKDAAKSRAVRDVYLAFALGAYINQTEDKPLNLPKNLAGQAVYAGAILVLKDAARRRAQAETALLAAQMIGPHSLSTLRPDDVASLLLALNDAGLAHISAQLAALDFLREG